MTSRHEFTIRGQLFRTVASDGGYLLQQHVEHHGWQLVVADYQFATRTEARAYARRIA